ncbi:SDR family oxidoreductase [Tomitella biformata]|uniref:SDR family oxidoreductase n=1 Tax=Tomitella biformata TaxID=630403 RepID=UPI0004631396|nr:SDR family NAD(P)-dependent oxidoreductase [Tomitella biformata]
MDIAGKVAIVTGGGGGIGRAIAQALVAGGAQVVVADLDAAAADSAAAGLDGAVAASGDVSDPDVIAGLLALAESSFGPVDLYFANAGIAGGVGLDLAESEWDATLDVNLRAHIRAAKLLMPGWLERGEGYFISTASAAGLLTQVGSAAYSVSKHAAVGFAEWLSITYGDKGIRVSCLCPMGVNTKLLYEGEESGDPLGRAATAAVVAAGRVLEPAECAEVVLAAVAAEQFLILPHEGVLEMYRQKGADYDRWIRGMRRYQAAVFAGLD